MNFLGMHNLRVKAKGRRSVGLKKGKKLLFTLKLKICELWIKVKQLSIKKWKKLRPILTTLLVIGFGYFVIGFILPHVAINLERITLLVGLSKVYDVIRKEVGTG